MASKRDKQGEQPVLQADQRQKRSNNQAKRQSSSAKRSAASDAKSEKAGKGSAPKGRAQSSTKSNGKPNAKATGKAATKPTEAAAGGVNREMKRMMKRREGAADRLRRPTAPRTQRAKPLTFVKQVRAELGKVTWPTRQETVTYTLVVIVTVAFFMVVIGAIDFVALKGVLFLIGRGGG